MAEPSTAFCTPDDLEDRMSVLGVELHADDGGSAGGGAVLDTDREALLERFCLRATDDVWFYLGTHYTADALAGSRWVTHRTVDLALYYLMTRRGDEAPGPVKEEYDRAVKVLDQVQRGERRVADLAKRKPRGGIPSVSNQRVQLWPHPHVVTRRKKSTGKPEDYVRHDDPTEWYDPGREGTP